VVAAVLRCGRILAELSNHLWVVADQFEVCGEHVAADQFEVGVVSTWPLTN
jgi:hypothetical protein